MGHYSRVRGKIISEIGNREKTRSRSIRKPHAKAWVGTKNEEPPLYSGGSLNSDFRLLTSVFLLSALRI
jgi:hypothetical protein